MLAMLKKDDDNTISETSNNVEEKNKTKNPSKGPF